VKSLAVIFCVLGGTVALAGPSITSQTPVSNFRLPTFTKEGHRSMLLQGTRAIIGPAQIDLEELNLTLFTGGANNAVETIILSPAASAEPESETVHGSGTVRVIRDDLEITGRGWTYDHRQKRVSIATNARVVFRASLPDILK